LQLLRTSQACTRYSAILLEITRHLPLLPQISSDTKHSSMIKTLIRHSAIRQNAHQTQNAHQCRSSVQHTRLRPPTSEKRFARQHIYESINLRGLRPWRPVRVEQPNPQLYQSE
jgi:hypothetical protein